MSEAKYKAAAAYANSIANLDVNKEKQAAGQAQTAVQNLRATQGRVVADEQQIERAEQRHRQRLRL
jgi:hypothetical protein